MAILILVLVIIMLVTVFSVQNALPVTISFLFWTFEASLAIVIFLSALSGIIIGAIGMSLVRMRAHRKKTEGR